METQFKSVVSSDLFVRLPADTVLDLLRSDNLSVESEEQVFEAIASWVGSGKKDANERLKLHAPNMLKEVRWCQTTLQFRKHLTDSHPMFQNGFECAKFMLQVEQWMSFADKDKPQCPFNQHRRPTLSFFVFGQDKDQVRWSVLRLDSALQNEERYADMERRSCASYSVVDANLTGFCKKPPSPYTQSAHLFFYTEESIFVVGGEIGLRVGVTCVEEFLVRERRWRKRAALAVGRSAHAAAVVKVDSAAADEERQERTLIGVFGGSSNEGGAWENLSSCEVYDVRQDRWYNLPDLREKRNGPAAVCLPGENRVFVLGGLDGSSSALASVEFCQLREDWQEKATSASTADFWLQAAPMRTARAYLAATHFRGRVVVVGGTNANRAVNAVEVFSPPDAMCPLGQWTDLAAMKQPRRSFALLATTDAIFALGNTSAPKNTIEVFTAPRGSIDSGNDLASWIWSSKCSVEPLSRIHGAASIRM
ncbi:distal tubule morphoproteinsis [Sparganum proliferum]